MPRGRPSTGSKNENAPAAGEKGENQFRIRLNLRKKEPSPTKPASKEENKENIRSPKITLSVRKLPSELPQINTNNSNSSSNGISESNTVPSQPPLVAVDRPKVGRPRGRPPKYPRPEGYVPPAKRTNNPLFTQVPRISESTMRLASLGRVPFRPLPTSPTSAAPLTHTSSISLREQERFKALQNALPQILSTEHEKLVKVDYMRPFESLRDVYERLLPFHVLAHAECAMPAVLEKPDLEATLSALQKRYTEYCRQEKELKVPMEIQLLENRLNLEEEKFLLQKLKTECMNKNGQLPQ